jgi:4-amino-4-deoxy-L-arabinose transferase-like glycosyltransferase
MIRLAMRRLAPVVLAAVVALAVVVRIGVVMNRSIDPDESQHLHAAWLVAQGEVPYRDFWEHHLPLFHYGMAPLTVWLADRPEVYFAGRGLMVVAATIAVGLNWRLARRLSADGAIWAVVVLLFLPQFAETSTETRPDVPALVAHLASLLALVRWREGQGGKWLWAAGAWQGVALALSLKALYGLVGVALVVAALPPTGPVRVAGAIGSLGRLAGGVAGVLAPLLAGLFAVGGWEALAALFRDVILGSAGFVDHAKSWPAYGSEVGTFLVAALGLGLVLRIRGGAILRHPVHGTLLVPALTLAIVLFLPRTPAVYQHAWLPLLPTIAVYAGLALATLGEWARRSPVWWPAALSVAALAAAVVVPAGESVVFAGRNQNAEDLALMRQQLRLACPGEAVLDGTALFVFRPAAYRQGVLIRGLREWVARGLLPEVAIAADMRRARAPVAHADRRIQGMVGAVAQFLERYYVPGPSGLLILGAEVPASTHPGRVPVELLRPGPYLLTFPSHLEVALDGQLVKPGWHTLEARRYEITWHNQGGTIRFAFASCPERRRLGAPGA